MTQFACIKQVDDTTPPTCEILTSSGDCSLTAAGGDCTAEFWSITFTAQDTGIGMHSVKPTEVSIASDLVINVATADTISGTYTSDCCVPRVTLKAIDTLGNSGSSCFIEHIAEEIVGEIIMFL